MNPDVFMLFEQYPGAFDLYEALETRIVSQYPDVTIRGQATQVTFSNTHGFLWAWPPNRRRKGWPKVFLGVTFGLAYRKEHARIVQSVEPYPNRWTHHVLVERIEDIDEQLMDWIDESHGFSLAKSRGRK